MRHRSVFFFTPLLLWAASGPQDLAAPPPPRVGVGLTQTKLTLREAMELALKNNLELEIERTNVANAAAALRAARGAFDPSLRYTPLFESRNTPAPSVLQGPGGKLAEDFLVNNLSFRQRTPYQGAAFSIDFDNSRNTTTNTFASLNPYYTSRLTFGVTMPLLRNRSIDPVRGEIRIRKKQLEISDAELELRIIDVVTRVEQAYWGLAAARQDAFVQSEGVGLAREQLARNQRMIAAGTLAPVELAASEAELQRRLDLWYTAVGAVTEAENALKSLIAPDRSSAIWSDEIIPTDLRTVEPPAPVELGALMQTALRKRLELRQLDLRLETAGIQRQVATEQVKPQVNFQAAYANAGLGGALRPGENPFSAATALQIQRLNVLSTAAGLPPLPEMSFGSVPSTLVGGYGSALHNLFAGRYQTFQAGISFDINLRNRSAEAGAQQAAVAERRIGLERKRAEQLIEVQVRNALQALETARQRIAAAAAGERAAKEKLDSEIRLFQTGESTNFLVLTRQNEFLDARRRAVVANLEFNRAVARLRQAIGDTLEAHQILLK
jgi:outer membrane protein TolC